MAPPAHPAQPPFDQDDINIVAPDEPSDHTTAPGSSGPTVLVPSVVIARGRNCACASSIVLRFWSRASNVARIDLPLRQGRITVGEKRCYRIEPCALALASTAFIKDSRRW